MLLQGYGAILSHFTFSIPETIPKSSGGKESSDSSTSRAALWRQTRWWHLVTQYALNILSGLDKLSSSSHFNNSENVLIMFKRTDKVIIKQQFVNKQLNKIILCRLVFCVYSFVQLSDLQRLSRYLTWSPRCRCCTGGSGRGPPQHSGSGGIWRPTNGRPLLLSPEPAEKGLQTRAASWSSGQNKQTTKQKREINWG